MLQRTVALALTLTTAGAWSSPEAARPQSSQALSQWQRTDSQRFEIHYLPALAPELDRVVPRAERAYDRISGRLDFVLATKVPLVMFAASEPVPELLDLTDKVAPRIPHRSRYLYLPPSRSKHRS